MKKLATVITTSMITFFLFAGIASAHVTVQPTQTTQGSYEMFTVRVPSEKAVPTTKIEIKFPNEVDVSRFEPKPGWKYDVTKDSTGKITSVTWTATDFDTASKTFEPLHDEYHAAVLPPIQAKNAKLAEDMHNKFDALDSALDSKDKDKILSAIKTNQDSLTQAVKELGIPVK